MWAECRIDVYIGNSTTAVAREQLSGHASPATTEHAITKAVVDAGDIQRGLVVESTPPCFLVLRDINTGSWPSPVGGVSKIGTIKYGLESRRTQTREGLRWRGHAALVNYIPVLSSERALQNIKLYKENFKEKEKLTTGLDGGLTPGQTDRRS
jgi:hypothetical protein